MMPIIKSVYRPKVIVRADPICYRGNNLATWLEYHPRLFALVSYFWQNTLQLAISRVMETRCIYVTANASNGINKRALTVAKNI